MSHIKPSRPAARSVGAPITLARAGLAGLALATLSGSLAHAAYGVRTVVGTSYQQSSGTLSPNGFDEGACNSNVCHVLFQQTPQKKPLIVEHVSCRVRTSAGSLIDGLLVSRKGQTFPGRRTYLAPVATASGYWVINTPVKHLLASGEHPIVLIRNTFATAWTLECGIAGELQEP